jgi:microcystin-dependent protein
LVGDYIYITGEIRTFAFGFTPEDWLACDGSSLKISQYQNLFSLLGTTYGGDGMTSFNLPDLRGRNIISQGQGPGLTNRRLGDKGGQETTGAAADKADAGKIMPPFLTLNYCICVNGNYPTRR